MLNDSSHAGQGTLLETFASGGSTESLSVSPAPARIPVHLRARDPISLAGLVSALTCRPEIELLGPGTAARARVGILAVDRLDEEAYEVLRTLRVEGCPRVVLVTEALTDEDVLAVVEAGVCAVVWRREATASWLSQVVVKAAGGEVALPADVIARLLRQVGRLHRQVLSPRGLTMSGLSLREIAVLKLAAEGMGTDAIAASLAYSARTVTNILHDVMCRYQLRNRTHAVAYALREGYI